MGVSSSSNSGRGQNSQQQPAPQPYLPSHGQPQQYNPGQAYAQQQQQRPPTLHPGQMGGPIPGMPHQQVTFLTPEQLQALFLSGQLPGGIPGMFGGPFGMPSQMMPPVPPPRVEHASTIRNDINVKKGSLRVVEDASDAAAGIPPQQRRLYLEFMLDTAAPCAVTVLYCVEEAGPKPQGAPLTACFRSVPPVFGGGPVPSPVRRVFPRGLGQKYSQALLGTGHLEPARFTMQELCAAGQARAALRPQEAGRPPLAPGGTSHVYPVMIVLEAAGESEREGDARTVIPDATGALFPATARPPGVPAPGSASGRVQLQVTYATLLFNASAAAAASAEGLPASGEPTVPSKAWSVRPLKQKIAVDSDRIYELREIYGVDGAGNSGAPASSVSGSAAGGGVSDKSGPGADAAGGERDGHTEAVLSSSSECVICLTEARDTTVIPCRHMCLCYDCALQLRMNTNRCPICRAPVQSLLRLKIGPAEGGHGNGTSLGQHGEHAAHAGVATPAQGQPSYAGTSESSAGPPPYPGRDR